MNDNRINQENTKQSNGKHKSRNDYRFSQSSLFLMFVRRIATRILNSNKESNQCENCHSNHSWKNWIHHNLLSFSSIIALIKNRKVQINPKTKRPKLNWFEIIGLNISVPNARFPELNKALLNSFRWASLNLRLIIKDIILLLQIFKGEVKYWIEQSKQGDCFKWG